MTCGWVTSHPFGQALFAPSTSVKPGGPVGLASHIGIRPLAVPSPLGAGGCWIRLHDGSVHQGRKLGPEMLFLL